MKRSAKTLILLLLTAASVRAQGIDDYTLILLLFKCI